ncbi:GAK system CofD-like protein [Desulfonatronum thiodismutans]|uniref:GAK system CofD-like protein n=1 Tax=Desulfonatronum thiodismutans TaxID=159290 RepID=UPI0004ABDE27|nr:GAK system CofD-like protein [Desulfonatronum thiodismutans]
MQQIRISRTALIPDELRLARYLKAPELGPRVLFFSGGTALNPLSRELVRYTHNSIHLVTPLDSGGSSAKLREAFRMPAVGDLRSRLMALADQSVRGNPEVRELFAHRLAKSAAPEELRHSLERLVAGRDALVRRIPDPMRKIVRNYLRIFQEKMPKDFDLRGASIGNLILTAGYLTNQRRIDSVVFLFSKLAEVRGVVRPTMNRYLHLAAELENGETIVGQHLLTGKETPPITARVKRVYIRSGETEGELVRVAIREKVRNLIRQADLICFPMGSFYSSLIANLLPDGVGQAIAENDCPKVYVPNTGTDPEQFGMTLADNTDILLRYLRQSCMEAQPVERLLNLVLLDSRDECYAQSVDVSAVQAHGVEVLRIPLVGNNSDASSAAFLDGDRMIRSLLSLI